MSTNTPTTARLTPEAFRAELAALDVREDNYATRVVDLVLALGRVDGVSDLHLLPTHAGLEVRWRLDGVLASLASLPAELAGNVIARLKVLAGLLTYRTDVPQEGRLHGCASAAAAAGPIASDVDMRLATCPTVLGEKALIRVFPLMSRHTRLDGLGYPADIAAWLERTVHSSAGVALICGPAGSGKTTTLYAALGEITASATPLRSVVSLEDPVERPIDGVAQTEIDEGGAIDMASGLKYLLRQDPEVIMVGEIRDRDCARLAFQAALTGHLVLSSFHAGSAAEAIVRLGDIGVDGYLLRSGLVGIVCQRLVRRLCECAETVTYGGDLLGLDVSTARQATGCGACRGTGYRGRLPIAELLVADVAMLAERETAAIRRLAGQRGMADHAARARQAVEAGLTSPAEVRRVFGFDDRQSDG
ncbi:MAG: ATPase, T2SS/T4P/T4SS family [Pirellulales bacterium]